MSAETIDPRLQRVKDLIGACPDFPKKGILFRDVFPMMRNPAVFSDCIDLMSEHVKKSCGKIDAVVGLDSRGFIFGPLIALKLDVAFVPVRKAGKLPGPTLKVSYQLEYGTDQFEVQTDSILPGQKIVIIDDLMATGGTMKAACKLICDLKAEVKECIVLIELVDLKGREKITEKVKSFICYEGE